MGKIWKNKKRMLSAALSLAMAFSMTGAPAFGAEEKTCGHVHDDTCMEKVLHCHHVHDASCYENGKIATDGDADCLICNHEHDDSCYEEVCGHVHDENCVFDDVTGDEAGKDTENDTEKDTGNEIENGTDGKPETLPDADLKTELENPMMERSLLGTNSTITRDEFSFDPSTGVLTIKTEDGYQAWRNNLLMTASLITEVVIADGVTEVYGSAFNGAGCDNLEKVTIADSVTKIGVFAFKGCTALTTVEMPDSITAIPESVFANCTSLTTIDLPVDLEEIGDKVFYSCSSLENITIPSNVKKIGQYAFRGCSNLASIELPDSVTSIGEQAFYQCGNLENLKLSESLTSIPPRAFDQCTKLAAVTIPDSVLTIGRNAFSACGSLAEVNLGKHVEKVDGYAFNGCDSLTHLTIPASVTHLGMSAFMQSSGVDHLVEVIMESVTPPRNNNCFTLMTKSKLRIKVPEGSIDKYLAASDWYYYRNALGAADEGTVTITLDPNGGSVSPLTVTTGADGRLTSLPTPSNNSNVRFTGWYTDLFAGDLVTLSTAFTSDTTIYARWANNSGGGSSSGGSSSEVWTYKNSVPDNYKGDTRIIQNFKVPSYVEAGTWQMEEDGRWRLKNEAGQYNTDTWVPAINPYANVDAGQLAYGWFRFDADGYLMTGWYTDAQGNRFYLNTSSDNTKGLMMTGWQLIDGDYYYFNKASDGTMGRMYRNETTPDGYQVDSAGRWIK